jgi:hypothetical protein
MMQKTYRERKPLAWQLGAVIHSTENMVSSKGKHRDEWDRMDKSLQNDFVRLMGLVFKVKADYDSFLLSTYKKNDKKLPSHLKDYATSI